MTPRSRQRPLWPLWILLALGLALYNWWFAAALMPKRFPLTPDQMYSDLEANGTPYARLWRLCDAGAALLFIAIGLAIRHRSRAYRRGRAVAGMGTSLALVGFFCLLGSLFPYTCSEQTSPGCHAREMSFQLPWFHYLHNVVGFGEFCALLSILIFAWGSAISWKPLRLRWTQTSPAIRWCSILLIVSGLGEALSYWLENGQRLASSIMMLSWSWTLLQPLLALAAVDKASQVS